MKMTTKMVMLALLTTTVGATAAQGSLLVSEVLFQPRSGEADYVELYNNGNDAINLADYHIVRWVGDSLGKHYPLPDYTIGAHDYVALTKNVASVTANYSVKYISKLIECNLPTYPNNGGSVIVCSADSVVVDRLDYTPTMHSRLLRNKAGVALERRSFDRPTGEAANWFSASSVAGYGTPGYENSQSSEWLVEEAAFVFSSTIISPDGDGYQDVLEIDYRLDDGSLNARVDIYDASGQPVRRLLNNALLGTHGTLLWDGTDENGKTVMPRQYIVDITVYNITGTKQTIRRAVACPPHNR